MESGSRHSSAAALVVTVVALALAVAGCGSSSGEKPSGSSDTEVSATPMAQVTGSPASDATVISVTVSGESVSPAGSKVEVERNQPIVFQIDATEAGELHVHSSPATAIDYPAGKSQAQITIDKPGVVEAEIEDLGKLVVQLEVK